MKRILLALVCGLTLGAGPHGAYGEDLAGLETRLQQVDDMLLQLERQRVELAGRADGLAVRIDSLKGLTDEADELHDALRASMVLVKQLRAIDQRLDALAMRRDELLEELRLAYDWEIGRLFQRLATGEDAAALGRLARLQQTREALGEDGGVGAIGYSIEVDLGPDDGPEEIRVKIQLLEDMNARLRSERQRLDRRLDRLEEEHRLRTRVGTFTGQLSLFDEHLPEGRVLHRPEAQGAAVAEQSRVAEVAFAPSHADDAAVPEPRVSRQLDRAGEGLGGQGYGSGDMAVEISKIKARQLEIRQLESVLAQHLATFNEHLQKLKDGRE